MAPDAGFEPATKRLTAAYSTAELIRNKKVVRPRGFEPLTYALEGRCSIQLSYERKYKKWYARKELNLQPTDPKSVALSNWATSAKLWGELWGSNPRPSGPQSDALPTELNSPNGRSERIRTFDPLVPNQMRYQPALHSEIKLRNWIILK